MYIFRAMAFLEESFNDVAVCERRVESHLCFVSTQQPLYMLYVRSDGHELEGVVHGLYWHIAVYLVPGTKYWYVLSK